MTLNQSRALACLCTSRASSCDEILTASALPMLPFGEMDRRYFKESIRVQQRARDTARGFHEQEGSGFSRMTDSPVTGKPRFRSLPGNRLRNEPPSDSRFSTLRRAWNGRPGQGPGPGPNSLVRVHWKIKGTTSRTNSARVTSALEL
eukprot:758220-Hanusia_phi.AAC.4